MITHSARLRIGQWLLLPLVMAATLLAASSAFAITRPAVLDRAQSWVDHPVPYSQAKYHLGYRTDCSGYVSMCWATGTSWATSSFFAVTHRIATSDLKPGDAMLKKGYHIRLFHNWANGSHTSYVAYEAGTIVAVVRVHSMSSDLAAGYVPTRYNGILDGPSANNVIWNGSFDAWTGSWDSQGDPPASWQVSGAQWGTLVAHRTDVYHTSRNSLQLLNPSNRPTTYTELSQAASVTASARYVLSAWARNVSNPAGFKLNVTYLDALGNSLAETGTTGEGWGVDTASFRPMSAVTIAPAGAVNAIVRLRLAGGSTGTTSPVAGTSAIIDDVSLTRQQASVSIKASATTARAGKTIVLSGSVAPTSSIGVSAAVYVKAPGGSWKRLGSSAVYASGNSVAWRQTFAFKRGMRNGVYKFRMTVSGFAGYLGATTPVVGVKLK